MRWLLLFFIVTLTACKISEKTSDTIDDVHSVHLKDPTEWWYFSGTLTDKETARIFGFHYVIFHAWDQVSQTHSLNVHTALIDEKNQLVQTDYHTIAVPDSSFAKKDGDPLNWVIGKEQTTWKLKNKKGKYRLGASNMNSSWSVKLTGTSNRSAYEYAVSSNDQLYGARYFSIPMIPVEGRLTIGDEKMNVTGELWYDRIINGQQMIRLNIQWQRFLIHLPGNEQLALNYFTDEETGRNFSFGAYFSNTQSGQELSMANINIEHLRHYKSEQSAKEYPVAWKVSLPDLNPAVHFSNAREKIENIKTGTSINAEKSGRVPLKERETPSE